MKSYRLTVTHLDPKTVSFETHDGKTICYPVHDDSVIWFEDAVRAAAFEILGRSTPAEFEFDSDLARDGFNRPVFVLSVSPDHESGACLEVCPGREPRQAIVFSSPHSPHPHEDLLEKFCHMVCQTLRPQPAPETYMIDRDIGKIIPRPEALGLKLSDYALPFTVDSAP